MVVWLIVAGSCLLAAASYDALSTTLVTTSAGGPLTRRIGRAWWSLARRLSRGPRSPLLRSAGPVITVATLGTWLALLWAGWTLVFLADPDAVTSSTTGQPADGWSRIYFAAYTTFTLGIGDYVPRGAPWQVVTSLATISGLALTTMAVTYVLPVVTAVTERRTQASAIAGLGSSPQDLLVTSWHDGSFAFLEQHVADLTSDLLLTAERHLSYPILHYFHSAQREKDLRVQLFVLDEAITLLQLAVPGSVAPHPAALGGLRHATTQLIRHAQPGVAHEPDPPDLAPLRAAGVPVVDDAVFRRRLEAEADHRRRLAAFADESPWRGPSAGG